MRPVKFLEAFGQELGAGENPNTGDLPYCIADDPNTPGVCFLVSCWKLSPEEITEIMLTGKIYLAVMANPSAPTQPPVSLHGLNPMTKYGVHNYVPWPENWRDIKIQKAINEIPSIIDGIHGKPTDDNA